MSRPVDVLADDLARTDALLAKSDKINAEIVFGRVMVKHRATINSLLEARAAVAEFVEKSDEAWKLLHNALNAGQLDARYAWIAADLHAALTKFGGQP